MNTFSRWWTNSLFRKWQADQSVRKYYSKYFHSLKGKIVLEIGTGSGVGAKIILKYFNPKKIIATDIDPRLVNLARKNIKSNRVVVEPANATKLDYQDKNFDAVFVYGVIHHIPSPKWKDCLSEIYRVLKPRGLLFL